MNVQSPEFIENPYPFYSERRKQGAAIQVADKIWTLTAYEALSTALQNSAAGRGNIGQNPSLKKSAEEFDSFKNRNPALKLLDQWMLFKNPPEHTEMRGKISRVMTSRVIEKLEQSMREVLRELFEEIKDGGKDEFDLVSAIAYPFPNRVIGDLLGIPRSSQTAFANWSQQFSMAVEADYTLLNEQQLDVLNQGTIELEQHFAKLLPMRESRPEDALIDLLLNGNGSELNESEVLANCVFLLFAGMETTAFAISNTVNAFLTNPSQLNALADNPGLAINAVEESLRFDPPIQMVGRYALQDFMVGEHTITQGSHIYAFLGAAGHDPLANEDPQIFDIQRQSPKHLAFARGAHHCLGAVLAKLELRVFIEEFFSSFPELSLLSTPQRKPTWLMRGFARFPLKIGNSYE